MSDPLLTLREEMQTAARELEFEKAASLRDELRRLEAARLAL